MHYSEPLDSVYDNTFVQLFMLHLNFEYTKAVIYTVENVGGGIGQDPWLNQPLSFFFQCFIICIDTT